MFSNSKFVFFLLLSACTSHQTEETLPEEVSEQLALQEEEPTSLFSSPEQAEPQSRHFPGPCALQTTNVNDELILFQTTILYDEAGNQRVEFTTNNQHETMRTYSYEGENNTLEIASNGRFRNLESRRRNSYEGEQMRLREHFFPRIGRDFRIAYRFEGENRHGDIDFNFDGFIDGQTNARMHSTNNVAQEDIDTNQDGTFEKRIINIYDENHNDVRRELYTNGNTSLEELSIRSFDAHNNLLGHTLDRGNDGIINLWSKTNYACWSSDFTQTCEVNQTLLSEMTHQVCALEYISRSQVNTPLVSIDTFLEPVRGVNTINVSPTGYGIDGTPQPDLTTTLSTLIELAAEIDRDSTPLNKYRIAIAPETTMSQLVPLLVLMNEHSARRIALVFDANVELVPDARRAGLMRDPSTPENTIQCEALQNALTECLQAQNCVSCATLLTQAYEVCNCEDDLGTILGSFEQRYKPERPQTAWSLRLSSESILPVILSPSATWAESYEEILQTNPNSFWIQLE